MPEPSDIANRAEADLLTLATGRLFPLAEYRDRRRARIQQALDEGNQKLAAENKILREVKKDFLCDCCATSLVEIVEAWTKHDMGIPAEVLVHGTISRLEEEVGELRQELAECKGKTLREAAEHLNRSSSFPKPERPARDETWLTGIVDAVAELIRMAEQAEEEAKNA